MVFKREVNDTKFYWYGWYMCVRENYNNSLHLNSQMVLGEKLISCHF